MEPIHRTTTLPYRPARVFSLLTDQLTTWWPREYTWSQERLSAIVIEPFAGGRCYERDSDGFTCDFGRVRFAVPGERLLFGWHIGPDRVPEPDPARASEVEVTLSGAPGGQTHVVIEHRAFERHGEGAAEYRAGMEQGWDLLVERLARAPAPSGAPASPSLRACVDVDDLERAITFYTRALGLRVERRATGFATLAGAALPVDLLEKAAGTAPFPGAPTPRSYTRHWSPVHLDVVVSDLEHALAHARALGATQEGDVTAMRAGRIAYLSDPFGNGLCLVELRGRGYLDQES